MPDETDVILKHIDQQWAQARQSEDHRAATTRYVLLLAVALQGFVVTLQFSIPSLGLAVVLLFLGIWGIVISAKYYERFRLHVCIVGRLMKWLEARHPKATLSELGAKAEQKHKPDHPVTSRVRLHWLWYSLHIGIVVLGVIDIVVIVIKSRSP